MGYFLAWWQSAEGSLNTLSEFNPLFYVIPTPSIHTHTIFSNSVQGSTATNLWEPSNEGGDHVPFWEQEQKQAGRKAGRLAGASSPQEAWPHLALTSWICLPGPRLPPACPGI